MQWREGRCKPTMMMICAKKSSRQIVVVRSEQCAVRNTHGAQADRCCCCCCCRRCCRDGKSCSHGKTFARECGFTQKQKFSLFRNTHSGPDRPRSIRFGRRSLVESSARANTSHHIIFRSTIRANHRIAYVRPMCCSPLRQVVHWVVNRRTRRGRLVSLRAIALSARLVAHTSVRHGGYTRNAGDDAYRDTRLAGSARHGTIASACVYTSIYPVFSFAPRDASRIHWLYNRIAVARSYVACVSMSQRDHVYDSPREERKRGRVSCTHVRPTSSGIWCRQELTMPLITNDRISAHREDLLCVYIETQIDSTYIY